MRQDKRRKARRQCAEGAYRKAVNTSTSDASLLSAADEARWAATLIPRSTQPALARTPPQAIASDSNSNHGPGGLTLDGTDPLRDDHPLKGVRFANLTAPGPTLTRAEHARECLGIKQRPVANRLARAMLRVQTAAQEGRLAPEARWLTRTRLTLIKKKASRKPRPIRSGEFLRAAMAKKVQKHAAPKLRRTFRQFRQWGVEMPGASEAMVHWRGLMEELAAAAATPPVVAFDLDLANMYGMIEGPHTRAAVSKHFQEAEAWVKWSHAGVESIELQSGGTAFSDRGAGQGDVFGGTTASLVLGESMEAHRTRMQAIVGGARTGAVDEWFIDDGQGLVLAEHAESWLKSVDAAITSFGGRRETGEECKSIAKLICPAEAVSRFTGWDQGYIGETCRIRSATSAPKVLGCKLGDDEVVTNHFLDTCADAEKVREAISVLESAQCELFLQRRCLDVGKVAYLLRCNGDRVRDGALLKFDAALRGGTEDAIHGRLRDSGWVHATLGVDAGGLGMKEASVIALPAFISSRVTSRPLVEEMCRHAETEGIGTVGQCMAAYDARTQAAYTRWLGTLPAGVHDTVLAAVEAAGAAAVRRWRCWCDGEEEEPEEHSGAPPARGNNRSGTAWYLTLGLRIPSIPRLPELLVVSSCSASLSASPMAALPKASSPEQLRAAIGSNTSD